MNSPLLQRTAHELRPDPARVIARLFLPGEEHHGHSRATAIVERVLALSEAAAEAELAALIADFAPRHYDFAGLLDRHASVIASRLGDRPQLSRARTRVLGASFTAEYSVEAAALLNPSAVLDIDQTGLEEAQVRVALSLRGIGEGHISSIGFTTAVIGPGARWTFEPRAVPGVLGTTSGARWRIGDLRAVLGDFGHLDELGSAIVHALPAEFEAADLERAITNAPPDLLSQPHGRSSIDRIRRLVQSAYSVSFDADVGLSQRVLFPFAADESNGMEDARFTRFVADDGSVEYRGTYTAYDGHEIAPRLLTSTDLRSFRAHRLAGRAARNKGMALFPRLVGGRHLALSRTDGESTSVTSSADGRNWESPCLVHRPATRWERLQVGNCGPPIETDRGWLVLTHAVGAMRVYTIGAMLLDLDDPTRMLGMLPEPLIAPEPDDRDGYVPNVVYSCGGVVHDGRLWIPYGIADARIGVAWVPLAALLDAVTG